MKSYMQTTDWQCKILYLLSTNNIKSRLSIELLVGNLVTLLWCLISCSTHQWSTGGPWYGPPQPSHMPDHNIWRRQLTETSSTKLEQRICDAYICCTYTTSSSASNAFNNAITDFSIAKFYILCILHVHQLLVLQAVLNANKQYSFSDHSLPWMRLQTTCHARILPVIMYLQLFAHDYM
jgi:hypothetical protein